MEDLDGTVQPIIDSCTKDAILVKYCCSPVHYFFSFLLNLLRSIRFIDSSLSSCIGCIGEKISLEELTRKFKLLSMGRDLGRGQRWRSNICFFFVKKRDNRLLLNYLICRTQICFRKNNYFWLVLLKFLIWIWQATSFNCVIMIAYRETDLKLINQGEKKTWSYHFIDKAFTN